MDYITKEADACVFSKIWTNSRLRSVARSESSDWLEVTQEHIERFADATGDDQWIHVDVERAKRELPGRTTIAHGLLTLRWRPNSFVGWRVCGS